MQQGSKETEDMRKTLLAHQFVAGLLPELNNTIAGSEGSFDQLLTKA